MRVTDGATAHRDLAHAVVLTPEQARKIGGDFMALAGDAEDQQERLRGDDRWHVKPHPDRPNVFLVKRHLWAGQYRERAFVQTELRKPRRCEVCSTMLEAGRIMYRDEAPRKWEHPSWREVRICSTCIRGGR